MHSVENFNCNYVICITKWPCILNGPINSLCHCQRIIESLRLYLEMLEANKNNSLTPTKWIKICQQKLKWAYKEYEPCHILSFFRLCCVQIGFYHVNVRNFILIYSYCSYCDVTMYFHAQSTLNLRTVCVGYAIFRYYKFIKAKVLWKLLSLLKWWNNVTKNHVTALNVREIKAWKCTSILRHEQISNTNGLYQRQVKIMFFIRFLQYHSTLTLP